MRSILFCLLAIFSNAVAGFIPSTHLIKWNKAGLLKNMATVTPIQVYVVTTMSGATLDEKIITAKNQARTWIQSSHGLAIIYFPEGQHDLYQPITVSASAGDSNMVFQGEGSDKTTLVFHNMPSQHAFQLAGGTVTSYTVLSQNIGKGDSVLHSLSTSLAAYNAKDWIWFFKYRFNYGDPVEDEIVGQISQVKTSGNEPSGSWCRIKDEANMYYEYSSDPSNNLRIYKFSPILNIGIEDLKITRDPNNQSAASVWNISFSYAINCWVKGVESYKCSGGHLSASRSSHLLVSGCYFHEAASYGGHGYGYGVEMYAGTTNCLIVNNIFRCLRHAMIAAGGSNCNVWAFNYSRERNGTNTGRDLDLHGKYPFANLFEQNIIQAIGACDDFGENGMYNAFVRNYVQDVDSWAGYYPIHIKNTRAWSILGNICTTYPVLDAAYHMYTHAPIVDIFAVFSGSYEYAHNYCHNFIYNDNAGQLTDVSYYFSSRPDFLSTSYTWPAIGPKNSSTDLTQSIPARARFENSKKTYSPDAVQKPLTTTGTMPYSQTWSANHTVTGNITIPSGITLTIKSGVTVTFSGSSYITVQPGGTIIAESGVVFSPSDRSVRYCGSMSTDNTWGFPVLVTSNLTVNSGKWLTVQPGTTVRVNSGQKITVNGKLIVNGSSSQPILFTSASGTWSGIELNYATASTMSYCTVQNASTGVLAYQTNLTLDHCTFSSNSYSGVTFENQASGTISNSIFSSNSTYGIRCLQYSNPVIRTVNRIWNNYGTAISGDGSSLPDLGSYYNYGNNSIKNNYPDDIWSDNVNTVYAQYNYWGSSSPEPYVSDNVEWEPYLSSDPTGGLGKSLAGQDIAAIMHEKPSSDTTGKQLFSKAYQAWIQGDVEAARIQFMQLAQDYPSSPAGQQALAFTVRCYDKSADADGCAALLDQVKKEKSNTTLSELAMDIEVGRLARSGKYKEALDNALKLLEAGTDKTLRKYALYDLATLSYHFINDRQNGEKYYRQLMAEYPSDPLAAVAATTLGQTVDKPVEEKLGKNTTLPTEHSLSQNYPNPFNPETMIQYALPEAAQVRIEVMNVLGQCIAVLHDQSMPAGNHTVRWDGRTASGEKASSGVYFCRMQAGGFVKTIKMMLLP